MDVLVFLILSIFFIQYLDRKTKSKLIKISFTSLNVILISLIAFCSEDPVVRRIINKIIDSTDYELFHQALISRDDVLVYSYSTYGAIFLFTIFVFIFTFIGNIVSAIVKISKKLYVLIKKYQKVNTFILLKQNTNINNFFVNLSNIYSITKRLRC